MIKKIWVFFDRLEDRVRCILSKSPIIYAGIVSIGTVLLWRGIWMIADYWNINGYISASIGSIILLLTGIFVSGFIGNSVLLAGMRKEKKFTEKTMVEIEKDMILEQKMFNEIKVSLMRLESDIALLKTKRTKSREKKVV